MTRFEYVSTIFVFAFLKLSREKLTIETGVPTSPAQVESALLGDCHLAACIFILGFFYKFTSNFYFLHILYITTGCCLKLLQVAQLCHIP